MAAELKLVDPSKKVTLIQSREKLLSSEPLPDDFKDKVAQVVKEQGVELILGHRVTKQETVELGDGNTHYKLTMSDGSEIQTGHVIWALSQSVPTTSFLPQNTLNEDGFVKIDAKYVSHGQLLEVVYANTNRLGFSNLSNHYAAGDSALWSGIKRCGGAMHMGHFAGMNIYQQLLLARDAKHVPRWKEIQEFPATIALAVGKQAVVYSPNSGTTWGEDSMKAYFGDDLGWSICWNWMGLGKEVEEGCKEE